ncbi:hypothetical protein MKY84_13155 [Chryseomicrobium sp. FSL W7-1435]
MKVLFFIDDLFVAVLDLLKLGGYFFLGALGVSVILYTITGFFKLIALF